MATVNDWLEGARVRTLPAAVSPVIVGAGIAVAEGGFSWIRTILAALVALFFQVGVNFANDYSDGIRGTDDVRTGPPRLTGGGKASPKTVKYAAYGFLALGALCGLGLVALSGQWWLLVLGVAAVFSAWFYTGGKNPYGYMGLGEVFVMIFFGYMATVGTVYTQTLTAPWTAWVAATAIGLIACALLMVNNIRDIPTDSLTGKHTLAVRFGERGARWAYVAMVVLPLVLAVVLAVGERDWALLLPLVLIPALVKICAPVLAGATGTALLPTLRNTGLYELSYSVLLCVGFIL